MQEVKYWTELRGAKLFFYSDKKQEKFTDSLDLQYLSSASDKHANQLQWTEVTLKLPNEEVYIKTETADVAEEWKGFILTVSQLSVPTCLTLLPGQIIQLKEVLEKEISRRESEVSRRESESKVGHPTYQDVGDLNRMPPTRAQVKHYRVLTTDHGFVIELDKPVVLNSLDEVVNHFIDETRGKLRPFVSDIYDTQIVFPR
ncbi:hypothetical protein GDO81_000905 [Engystomops pustulosus]|uniref:Signal-transducing adaptor protein 1 n=1 Tax=Engystomops pustulosus TaxID=76066 RepID=A0AAV7D850_ENGPU|nr:hypothetical protein GDO81_000905 [Engystomops pustulosus]